MSLDGEGGDKRERNSWKERKKRQEYWRANRARDEYREREKREMEPDGNDQKAGLSESLREHMKR
jgi:hypothetical protein